MFYFFNANYCIHHKLKNIYIYLYLYIFLNLWKTNDMGKIQHPNKYGQEGNQHCKRTF